MQFSRLYKEDNTNYIIKRVEDSQEKIILSSSIIDWVKKRGFNNILDIKKTYYGRPYIKINKKKYLAQLNIKGKKLRLTNNDDLRLAMSTLAKFHLAAEGYPIQSGIKIESSWGRCMEKYKTFIANLEKYAYKIERYGAKNEFEKVTSYYLDDLYNCSKKTIDFFRSEKYILAIEESMKKREVCINDFTQNSVLIDKNKNAYITKIYSLGYNMCEEDIASILRRYIEETGRIEFLQDMINEYTKIRELSSVSKENLINLVMFPESPIKIISKYMKKGLYKDNMLEKFLLTSRIFIEAEV